MAKSESPSLRLSFPQPSALCPPPPGTHPSPPARAGQALPGEPAPIYRRDFDEMPSAIAPSNRQTVKPLNRYTVTPLHYCTVAPLRRYTVAPLHRCTIAPLHRYAVTPLHRCTVTPLRPYAFMPLCPSPLHPPPFNNPHLKKGIINLIYRTFFN